MTSRPRALTTPALVLFAVALAACGSGMEAKPEPKPASPALAFRQAASGDDACGTFERPCVLQEIRVQGALAE
ncbi:MAG TPA: hypothetical protein VHG51_06185 [Longimicrobiaceae bacterium]|nr:hypothetical protein [Longimicrobiaceae bacterium]